MFQLTARQGFASITCVTVCCYYYYFAYFRGVFRAQSNIYDKAFLRKLLTAKTR